MTKLSRWHYAGALVSISATSTVAAAQVTPPPPPPALARISTCGRDSTGLGRITGKLLAASPEMQLTRSVIAKTPTSTCMSRSDATGTFTIKGLPPGEYEVSIGDLWIDYIPPVKLRVQADSASITIFQMNPENRARECLAVSACAKMLTPPPAATLTRLTEMERVREAAARMGIALTLRPAKLWESSAPLPVICVGSATPANAMSEATVAALRERFPTVRPVTGCERAGTGRGGMMKAVGSDERAILISVTTVEIKDDIATVNGGVPGSGWECTFKRTGTNWVPTSCKTTGVS